MGRRVIGVALAVVCAAWPSAAGGGTWRTEAALAWQKVQSAVSALRLTGARRGGPADCTVEVLHRDASPDLTWQPVRPAALAPDTPWVTMEPWELGPPLSPAVPAPTAVVTATAAVTAAGPVVHAALAAGLVWLGALLVLIALILAQVRRCALAAERQELYLAALCRRRESERPDRLRPEGRSPDREPVPGAAREFGGDHRVAVAVACELPRMRKRIASLPESGQSVSALAHALDRLESELQAAGYEVRDRTGEEYHDGMCTKVMFVQTPGLAPGEQRVVRMVRPEVRYRGTVIEPGQAEVAVGPAAAAPEECHHHQETRDAHASAGSDPDRVRRQTTDRDPPDPTRFQKGAPYGPPES